MAISLTKGVYIFDIEADALLDECTKIHCLSIGKVLKNGELRIVSTTDYNEMRAFFLNKEITKVGHNIISYDLPVAEKILGIKVSTNNVIDTLLLSWYLSPERNTHGLENYGTEFGIAKPVVEDWKNLTSEEYIFRCSEDVKINYELFKFQRDYLLELYRTEEIAIPLVKYLNFKRICIREQETIGIEFDVDRATTVLAKLEIEKAEKMEALGKVIPPEDVCSTKTIPKEMYKKDGSMAKKWQDWLEFKRQYNIPDGMEGPIKYVTGSKPGNPGSPVQIKNWLYGLGWEPCTLSYIRNKKTNTVKTVPQIYNKDTGEATPSVKKLYVEGNGIDLLNGLGKLKHRIGLIGGLIEACKLQEDGTYRIYPSMNGLANTLRIKHKVVTNLPKPSLYMGEEIRGCFVASKGDVLCGSDLNGIENATRNHWIYPYDKSYVEDQDRPDFDPHIDIGILSGKITEADGAWYVTLSKKIDEGYHLTDEESVKYKDIKKIRNISKIVNFASVYGVSPKTLSRNFGMPEKECRRLIDTYWQRNWSVKAFAADCKVKIVGDQMWILNTMSGFWLSLRSDKDRFSTMNQSSAVFVFDTWVACIRKLGIKIQYQCHDEALLSLPEGEEDNIRDLLKEAMRLTNEQLQLNVTIGMSPSFGSNYAACH